MQRTDRRVRARSDVPIVEEARVVAAGGDVVRSEFSIGEHGFVSIVADTEGNTIGLHFVAA